jgi:hypothetical protein
MRSGLSRPDITFHPDVDQGLSAIAGDILGHDSLTPKNVPFRKAVLQHYGYKTHYVDVTSDPAVAAWFATNRFQQRKAFYIGSPMRFIEQIQYVKRSNGEGYILLLALPSPETLQANQRLFDISKLNPFLRPDRQKAWLLLDRRPLVPDPNEFWVATIRLDCAKFPSTLSSKYLFPLPTEDQGYRALLAIPFVEVPDMWLSNGGHGRKKPRPQSRGSVGLRALPIPEHVHPDSKVGYDHKWNDMTLTEPFPMQMWVKRRFKLEQEMPGVQGDIGEATKITLSPRALLELTQAPAVVPLNWPRLGTDELLFTFAQWGHDKVYDIEYPYRGVWLHRDRDLVIEHPISSSHRSLRVRSGHVFEFVGGQVVRQELPSSCQCGDPESHDVRVRSMLRLSALVEAEILVLVPHPIGIPNWYFAL